jgi:spore maturation protein CgeB
LFCFDIQAVAHTTNETDAAMHFVIFGLTVSSSWGNGHATLWRGLLKAMGQRGHTATFYERDVPYYASTRDGWPSPQGITIRLFESIDDIQQEIARDLTRADVALVTSYCQDGPAVSQKIFDSNVPVSAFYDLDTPVTLDALRSGEDVGYLPENGLGQFDIVLSYTGGRALNELRSRLGARLVAPLYGWVDPETHAPTASKPEFRSTLSYLGTYAADRQQALEELFVSPARSIPRERFVIGGAQYPDTFPWSENIFFVRHLPPGCHSSFFCSSRTTLSVTRRAMAEYGYCPSGRLFEATACGTPLLSDTWEGLETFFDLGSEILPVHTQQDVVAALSLSDFELVRIGQAARARTLAHHTAEHRVSELEAICVSVGARGSIDTPRN